jgi:hypothetical protein
VAGRDRFPARGIAGTEETLLLPTLICGPENSGWLYYGQLFIDASNGATTWTIPPHDVHPTPARRLIDQRHLAHGKGTLPNYELTLKVVPKGKAPGAP